MFLYVLSPVGLAVTQCIGLSIVRTRAHEILCVCFYMKARTVTIIAMAIIETTYTVYTTGFREPRLCNLISN